MSSVLFGYLVSRLGALPWGGDWRSAHDQAEEFLTEEWRNRAQLMRALQEHINSMALPNITRTAELHSWMLHNGGDWCLKLNQFIPSPNTGRRSENVHDHTRPLTSLTLAGGYTQDFYDPWTLREGYGLGDAFTLEELPSAVGPTTYPGMVYTMDTNIFHALNGFEDGTLTLCLYGTITKEGIRVFNTVSGRVEERITYGAAKSMMLKQLHGLEETDCTPAEAAAYSGALRLTAAGGR